MTGRSNSTYATTHQNVASVIYQDSDIKTIKTELYIVFGSVMSRWDKTLPKTRHYAKRHYAT